MIRFPSFALAALLTFCPALAALAAQPVFVGQKACGDCHPEQLATFAKYAKKAKSDKSVKILAKKVTPDELKECYACHTTGYGKPGGFVSFEQTPELANAGCEVCHGPGSAHVDSGGDPKLIVRKPSMQSCRTCHNEERVKSFGFKPLTHAGAH